MLYTIYTIPGGGAAAPSNMPRDDRTFNDTDVIRIINKHLTAEERDKVILFICGDFEESDILRLLYILRDAVEQVKDIIEPVAKWLRRVPILRQVLIVLEIVELMLNTLILLIELFESL